MDYDIMIGSPATRLVGLGSIVVDSVCSADGIVHVQ